MVESWTCKLVLVGLFALSQPCFANEQPDYHHTADEANSGLFDAICIVCCVHERPQVLISTILLASCQAAAKCMLLMQCSCPAAAASSKIPLPTRILVNKTLGALDGGSSLHFSNVSYEVENDLGGALGGWHLGNSFETQQQDT